MNYLPLLLIAAFALGSAVTILACLAANVRGERRVERERMNEEGL